MARRYERAPASPGMPSQSLHWALGGCRSWRAGPPGGCWLMGRPVVSTNAPGYGPRLHRAARSSGSVAAPGHLSAAPPLLRRGQTSCRRQPPLVSHPVAHTGHEEWQSGPRTRAMDEGAWLAERFEEHQGHLRAVAYRMLGSLSEADDAVQEASLRLSGSDASEIENLGGWLATVVAPVCLNMLQSRKARREEPLSVHVPDPIVSVEADTDPEQEALLADSVGARAAGGAGHAGAGRAAGLRAARRHVRRPVRPDRVPSSGSRRPPPGSWPAGLAAGSTARPRCRIPTWAGGTRWWTPSWPPRGRGTSTRCSRSWTRTWCSARTAARWPPRAPGRSGGPGPSPGSRSATPGWAWACTGRW